MDIEIVSSDQQDIKRTHQTNIHCPMSSILAIIINWNGLELTRRCIHSLVAQSSCEHDILVVDNCSDVNPEPILKHEFPAIRLIRNTENLGVAGGRNVGLKFAIKNGYEFVLLIDNDAFAGPDMLRHLSEASKRCPSAAILGPKIYRDDKAGTIWRAGCTSWKFTYLHCISEIIQRFYRRIGRFPPKFMDTARGIDQPDEGQFDTERDISFQIGCAQFIRTAIFNQVELLDEQFSPYGSEDIDFCARVTKAGWIIWFVPSALCWHRSEGSFRDDYNRTYYNARNLILLARKNLSIGYFCFLFLPDFLCLTIPLILLDCYVRKIPNRRKAFIDAINWNIRDVRARGLLLRSQKLSYPNNQDSAAESGNCEL